MNVDDFLEKTEISMGNTQNMQNFGHFLLPYGHFKGYPVEPKLWRIKSFLFARSVIYQNVRHGL